MFQLIETSTVQTCFSGLDAQNHDLITPVMSSILAIMFVHSALEGAVLLDLRTKLYCLFSVTRYSYHSK